MNVIASAIAPLRRLDFSTQLALVLLVLALVVALFPARFATDDPYTLELSNRLQPPDSAHLLAPIITGAMCSAA